MADEDYEDESVPREGSVIAVILILVGAGIIFGVTFLLAG